MLLEVRDRFRIEGLDDIIMQKWIRGERCNARLGEIYRTCQQIINKNKKSGNWSNENQAEFEEASLRRVEENFSRIQRMSPASGIPLAISQMCIAEQLPESEKRDELIAKYRE